MIEKQTLGHPYIFAKRHWQLCKNNKPEGDPVPGSSSQFRNNAETKKPVKPHYEYIISKIQIMGNATGQTACVFQQVKERAGEET